MSKAPESSADPLTKKRKLSESSKDDSALALVSVSGHQGPSAQESAAPKQDAQLVFREQLRHTLDMNPSYVQALSERGEIGYWRSSSHKVPKTTSIQLDVDEIKRCMSDVFTKALQVAYQDHGSMRQSEITAEIAVLVPLTIDICVTALYAKLRNIHRTFGTHTTRYTTAPSYSKDIELPLPFALAIQELGIVETCSLEDNLLCIPTFPEGTTNEGRTNAAYKVTEYQSYVPTLRELQLPLKSVDVHIKTGSPWWTYKIETHNNTVDLICTIPSSLYTDFSTQLRMLFLAPTTATSFEYKEIRQHDANATEFGVRAKELRRGINLRTFLALSHYPSEWWTFS